jgi:hypothetical protein
MVLVPSARAAGLRAPALSRTLATPASSIGATKVPMSLFDKDRYINYQRIEDNLQVVRQRSVCTSSLCPRPVLPAVGRVEKTSCILGVPSRPHLTAWSFPASLRLRAYGCCEGAGHTERTFDGRAY